MGDEGNEDDYGYDDYDPGEYEEDNTIYKNPSVNRKKNHREIVIEGGGGR